MKRLKKGFTLAEVLIALLIIGIIAIITVPSIIQKNREAQRRTKLSKAMAVYDTAISKLSILSGAKTLDELKDWAEEDNCENALKYFKGDNVNGCIFRTSDGIWWNIADLDRAIISFEEINEGNKDAITLKAQDSNDFDAFVLVANQDEKTGAFRIDDLAYEDKNGRDNNCYAYVSKLYSFKNSAKGNTPEQEECDIVCRVNKLLEEEEECKDGNTISCFLPAEQSPYGCDELYNEKGDVVYDFCGEFAAYHGQPFGEDVTISLKPDDPTFRSVETPTYIMTEGYLFSDDIFIEDYTTKDPETGEHIETKATSYNDHDPEKRKVVSYEYHSHIGDDKYYISLADNDKGFDPNETDCLPTSEACKKDFPEVYNACNAKPEEPQCVGY